MKRSLVREHWGRPNEIKNSLCFCSGWLNFVYQVNGSKLGKGFHPKIDIAVSSKFHDYFRVRIKGQLEKNVQGRG